MGTRRHRIPNQKYADKVEICEAYLKAHKRGWQRTTAAAFRARIYHFHRWLSVSKGDLRDVDGADLKAYWQYLVKRGVTETTVVQYQSTIKVFLKWLAAKGQIRRTPVELEIEKPIRPWLMEHARKITESHANKVHRIYVGEFYDWLEREQIPIETLTRKQLQEYERLLRNQVPARSVGVRRINMRMVQNHLRWLCAHGLVKTSQVELGLGRKKQPTFCTEIPLPPQAKKFLRHMAANRRKSTVMGHQTRLRHFYDYLRRRQLSLEHFSRLDFEEYLASMHRDGFAPQTRIHAIGAVQIHLSWLHECGFLAHDPEPIIGNFQRPRRPDYLPRNLAPDVDRLVQECLERRADVVGLALLLMRRTGIRIGDLTALPYDCLRDDPDGNAFMKVPIGKLYNERFVPLDAMTLATLKRIKALSLKNNSGRKPELLAIRCDGKPVTRHDYHLVLYEIGEALRLDAKLSLGEEPLVSHRLRHTFATSLLSAGMNIEGIKELLGHRSLSMSLRYAQVTPQKLRSDYLKAIAAVEGQVTQPELAPSAQGPVLRSAIDEVLAQIRGKLRTGHSQKKQLAALIRRIERVRSQLRKLD